MTGIPREVTAAVGGGGGSAAAAAQLPHAVAKGLYIGAQGALDHAEGLGITHVLSVVNYDVHPPEGLCHWRIDVEDAETADLLHQLPTAVTWLERSMRQAGSKVLVHCNAGVSRSASVVIAAIMKAKGMSVQDAVKLLQARVPQISPNSGFMAQLELWGEMGCIVDEAHPGYKQFLLAQTAQQWEEQGYVDPESMAALPEDVEVLTKVIRYRCRKCRQLLATEHNIIPQEGVGRRIFRQQQRTQHAPPTAQPDNLEQQGSIEHGAVFLQPISWMADQIVGPVQGKLYCPHCNARLGSFNWAGISNSSGAWIIPGFQVHLSKVDQVSPQPPVALSGMRFPVALAEHRQAGVVGQQEQQQQQQQSSEGGLHAQPHQDFLPDIDDV